MCYPQYRERYDRGKWCFWEASLPFLHFVLQILLCQVLGTPTSAQAVAPPLQPSQDAQSCSGCMEKWCPLPSHSLPASTWNSQAWFLCKPNTPAFICITSPLCQKENNKIKEQSTAVNTNLKAESISNTCPRAPNPSIERWCSWKEVAERSKVFSEIPEA